MGPPDGGRKKANETERRCSRCREVKPLSDFGKCATDRLGTQSACRTCMSELEKLRRANMTPEQRKKRRGYAKSDYQKHRVQRLEWHHKYREESRAAVIASGKRSKSRRAGAIRAARIESQLLEPQKHRAQDISKRAIRDGFLVPGKCEINVRCLGAIQGHHDDYLKPMSVRWMCRRHHQQWHAQHGPGLNATAPCADGDEPRQTKSK